MEHSHSFDRLHSGIFWVEREREKKQKRRDEKNEGNKIRLGENLKGCESKEGVVCVKQMNTYSS